MPSLGCAICEGPALSPPGGAPCVGWWGLSWVCRAPGLWIPGLGLCWELGLGLCYLPPCHRGPWRSGCSLRVSTPGLPLGVCGRPSDGLPWVSLWSGAGGLLLVPPPSVQCWVGGGQGLQYIIVQSRGVWLRSSGGSCPTSQRRIQVGAGVHLGLAGSVAPGGRFGHPWCRASCFYSSHYTPSS